MQPFTGKPMDWFESKTNADILKVLGKDYRNQPFLDKVFFNTTGGYSHLWKQMAQMLPRDVWNRRTLYPLSLAGATGTIGYQIPSTQEMMEKYGK